MVAVHRAESSDDIRFEAPTSLPVTVRASSAAAALAEVRSRLGDDAVVLSTRTLKDPETGRRQVEVKATLDSEPPAPRVEPKGGLIRSPSATPAATSGEDALSAVLQELRGMRADVRAQHAHTEAALSEVRALRRELREVEHVVSSLTSEHAIMREHAIPAEWVPAYRRLLAGLIDPAIADELLKETIEKDGDAVRDSARINEALVQAVAARIRVKPILEQAVSPPVISVVGPGGSGKTSMIAKLAAHAVLKGAATVGIVTSDASSLEHLSRVASALGVPVTAAEHADGALARAISAMQSDGIDLVLVDTPACRLADRDANRALWRELGTIPGNEILAVLSATTRDLDLNRAARELSKLGFHRFAFTHLDETLRTGGLLTAIAGTGRPIGALSSGPRITDDFTLPDPRKLAEAMVRPPRVELSRRTA